MSKQIRKVLALLLSCAMVVTSFTFIGTNNLKAADEEAADQQIEQIDETADAEAEQVEAEDLETTEETLDIAEEGDGTSDGEEATSEQAGDAEKAAEEAKAEEEKAAEEKAAEEQKKEEAPKPAQEFNGLAGNGISVYVKAPEGAFEEGTTMKVSAVSSKQAKAYVEDAVDKIADAQGVDITFYDKDGKEVQPGVAVHVSLSGVGVNGKNASLYHVDGGTAEKVKNLASPDEANFKADSFSVYVIVTEDEEKTYENKLRLTVHYIDASGINLEEPYTVELAKENGKFVYEKSYSVEDGYSLALSGDKTGVTLTKGAAGYNLKAVYEFGEGEDVLSQDIYVVRKAAQVDYKVIVMYQQPDGTYPEKEGKDYIVETRQGGVGDMTEVSSDEFEPRAGYFAEYIDQKEITADGKTEIIVQFSCVGVALVYNTQGGGYIPTQRVAYGEEVVIGSKGMTCKKEEHVHSAVPTQDPCKNAGKTIGCYKATKHSYWGPCWGCYSYYSWDLTCTKKEHVHTGDCYSGTWAKTPSKQGYEFGGWYLDPDCVTPAPEKITIYETTTIYAKWIPKTAEYKVAYFKQVCEDGQNLTYAYLGSKTATGTVGGEVTGKDDYSTPKYHEYSHSTTSVVQADGSTVVNVFYDLTVYTLRFDLDNSRAKIEIDGKTYKNSEYSFETVLGLDISSKWPYYENTTSSDGCVLANWDDKYNTKRFETTSDLLPSRGKERTYTAYWTSTKGKDYVRYWLENPEDEKYSIEERYSQYLVETNLSAKNIYGFTHVDSKCGTQKNFDANGDGKIQDNEKSIYVYNFYYDRKTTNIVYVNGNNETKKSNIKFGKDISGPEYNYTPTRPSNVSSDAVFAGWYENSECEGDRFVFTTMPYREDGSLLLYAKWVRPDKTVTFVYNDGKTPNNTINVQSGQIISAADPVYEGHIFAGWYTDEACKNLFDMNQPIEKNTTLYAKWDDETNLVEYTIKYQTSDGTPVSPSKTLNGRVGASVSAKAVVGEGEYKNYTPDQAKKTLTLSSDASDNVITFTYTDIGNVNYTVEYRDYNNKSTILASKTQLAGALNVIVYPNLKNSGITDYQAYSVLNEAGNSISMINLPIDKDAENNVAVFYLAKKSYTITFSEVDGAVVKGTSNPISSIPYTYGDDDITLPIPERAGQNFLGWDFTPSDSEHARIKVNPHNPALTIVETGSYGELNFTARWGSLDAEDVTATYDGESHGPSGITVPVGYTLKYSVNNGLTWSGDAPTYVDAGAYKVIVKAEKDGYITLYDEVNVVINRKEVTVTANDATKKASENDPAFTASITGLIEKEAANADNLIKHYTFSRATTARDGKATNNQKGEYDINVIVSQEEQGNYKVVAGQPGTLTIGTIIIGPSGDDFSLDTITDIEYNGEERKQDAKVVLRDKDGNPIASTNYDISYSGDLVNVTEAGVTVRVTGKGDYEGYRETTYKITQKTATVVADDLTKARGEADPELTYKIEGIVDADKDKANLITDFTVTRPEANTEAGETKGDHTITVTVTTASQGNYNVVGQNGTLTIDTTNIGPEGTDFSLDTIAPVTYNGLEQKQPVVLRDKSKNIIPASNYDVTYSDDVINVGTVTVTVTGKGAYEGYRTTTYQINPAPVTVTANDTFKYFSKAEPALTATVSGLVNNEPESKISYSLARAEGEAVTTGDAFYAITVTAAADQGNYTVSTANGKFTVQPGSIDPGPKPEEPDPSYAAEVSFPQDCDYDGDDHQWLPVVTNVTDRTKTVSLDNFTITYKRNGEVTTDFTDAGTITVIVEGKGNYTGTVERTYTIRRAKLTVNTESATKKYDNEDLRADGSYSGLQAGETIDFATTGVQRNVGSSKNTYAIKWYGEKNSTATALESNYNVVEGVIGMLTVSAAKIGPNPGDDIDAIAKKPADRVYNGEEYKPTIEVVDAKTGAAISEDDYTVEFIGDDFTNVGEKKVKVTGNNNYQNSVVTLKYNIKPATLTVTTQSAYKKFDGDELTATGTYSGLVKNEKIKFRVTGKQTAVGSSNNTYEIKWEAEEGETAAKQSNYTISETIGTLTVSKGKIGPEEDTTAEAIAKAPASRVYTGSEYKPEDIEVIDVKSKKNLKKGTDYTIDYPDSNYKDVGEKSVVVTGIGNYKDSLVVLKYNVTKAPLTVTTKSASKKYDGSALTAEGSYTGLVNSETIEFEVTGSQLNKGSSDNTYTIKWAGEPNSTATAKASNYAVSATVGKLTVTKGKIGTDDDPDADARVGALTNVPYSGVEQKLVPSVLMNDEDSTPLTEGEDYRLEYTSDEYTDVGIKYVNVIGINNYDGSVVNLQYRIKKVNVTIKTESASKKFDGTELTAEGSVSGLKNNETVMFTVTGKQTAKGKSTNTYSIKWFNKDEAGNTATAKVSNYNVVEDLGTLTVTRGDIVPDGPTPDPNATAYAKAPGNTTYTGVPQQLKPLVYKNDENKTLKDENKTLLEEGKDYRLAYVTDGDYTNVGEKTVTVIGLGDYEGEELELSYRITEATLTITTEGAEKKFDGDELTNANYTLKGLQHDETVVFKTTGKQTAKGSSDNTYEIKWKGEATGATAVATNYTISATLGKLKVTAGDIVPDGPTPDENATAYAKAPGNTVYTGQPQQLKPVVYKNDDKKGTDNKTLLEENKDYELKYVVGGDYTNVGEKTVRVVGLGDYVGSDFTLTYQITRKTVTVTPVAASKVFGELDPDFTATTEGLLGNDTISYNVVRAEGENAGTYTMSIAGNVDQGNYTLDKKTATFTITAGEIKPGPNPDKDGAATAEAPEDVTYDGTQHHEKPVVYKNDAAKTPLEEHKDYELEYVSGDDKYIDAGEWTVKVIGIGNYAESKEITLTFKINPMQVTVTPDDKSKKLNENDPTLTATLSALATKDQGKEDELISYELERATGETVGTYTISVKGENNEVQGNYKLKKETGTLTITEGKFGPPDVEGYEASVQAPADTTYTGTEQKLAPTVTDNKTGEALATSQYDLVYESADYVNIGTVKVKVVGKDNYAGSSMEVTYDITRAAATVTARNASKEFGAEEPTSFLADFVGVNNETETFAGITYSVSRTAGEAAGTYTITPSGDRNQGNYTITYVTGTFTIGAESIKPNEPTYNGVQVQNPADPTYNGENQYAKPVVTDKDGKLLIEGQDYTLEYPGNDYKNQGAKTVVVHGINNYKDSVEATYTILRKAVTVTAHNKTITVGDADVALTAAVSGTVGDDTVAYSLRREEGTGVGTYTIFVETSSPQGNYTVTGVNGTYTIAAAEVEPTPEEPEKKGLIVIAPADPTYDGDVHKEKPIVTDEEGKPLTEGRDYTVSYPDSGYKDAGTYTIVVTGNGDYAGTYTVTFTIQKRKVTLTSADASKEYDGTPLTKEELTIGGDGFVDGEGFVYKFTGSQTNVGKSENTFGYVISESYSKTKESNYAVTLVFGTLEVTEAEDEPVINRPDNGPNNGPVVRAIQNDGEIVLQEIADEETPLANFFEDCCVLHLILLFMALCLFIYYMYDSKKRKGRIYDLEEELAKHGVIYW